MIMESTVHMMKDSLSSNSSPGNVNVHGHNQEVIVMKSALKKISKFQQPRNERRVQGSISKGRRLSFADENGLTLETVKEFNSSSDSVGISTSKSIVCVIS
jgi:hypothetical protein